MFFPELKSRREPTGIPLRYETRPNGASPWTPRTSEQFYVDESIISQCHTGQWSKRRSAPRYGTVGDIGGFMDLSRTSARNVKTISVNEPRVRGTVGFAQLIGIVSDQLGDAVAASRPAMDAFGTSAIAAVLPTNPQASLATALGELKKDGLPRLPGSDIRDQVSRSRAAGSEYLNIEFGWLPLVSDLQDFAHSIRNAQSLIAQYQRDSDRKVRRRYSIPDIVSHQVQYGSGQTHGSILGTGSVTSTLTTRFWFSGAFRYHVPVSDSVLGKLARYESYANHLLGTRITPEVLWELAPWSWAVDWFSNAGDVIHNISALGSDGLVMQYGYAMRHMQKLQLWSLNTPLGTVQRENLSETKQRVAANPYGFGIDDVSLTARQLAILAALGLSRGQRDNTRL